MANCYYNQRHLCLPSVILIMLSRLTGLSICSPGRLLFDSKDCDTPLLSELVVPLYKSSASYNGTPLRLVFEQGDWWFKCPAMALWHRLISR